MIDYALLRECFSVTMDILPYFLAVGIGFWMVYKGVEFVRKCSFVPVGIPDIPVCENLEYYGSCENCPYNLECDYK